MRKAKGPKPKGKIQDVDFFIFSSNPDNVLKTTQAIEF